MRLYVAFKGIGNSANRIVSSIEGDKVFLTNSFGGLKKDIDKLDTVYDEIYMFGLDKKLKESVRIERCAENDGIVLHSRLDLQILKNKLTENAFAVKINESTCNSLCNSAYWYMLQKYNGRAVFFHVPSVSYVDNVFIDRIKESLAFAEEISATTASLQKL